jgi:hypothetical protein
MSKMNPTPPKSFATVDYLDWLQTQIIAIFDDKRSGPSPLAETERAIFVLLVGEKASLEHELEKDLKL